MVWGLGFPLRIFALVDQDAAAFSAVTAFEDDADGFGVNAMFLVENALRESFGGVVIVDGDASLADYRAGVEIFIDEMDGAAREFCAVGEGLVLGFEAREGGEERRVDVEDAGGERRDEEGREKAHVAGETDELDVGLVKSGGNLAIEGFAFEALRRHDFGGNAALVGFFDAGGAFAIADDQGDARVGNASGVDAVGEGFEIGAAAGEKDADLASHFLGQPV